MSKQICTDCGHGCPQFTPASNPCCDTDLVATELEASLSMYFSCSEKNLVCWATGVYDAEAMMQQPKAEAYSDAIMDYAYLYTYLTVIYWQMVEDRAADPCGNDKGALYYYQAYNLDCIVKYFRCKDLDVRPMLASFRLYPFDQYTDGIGFASIDEAVEDQCPTNDAIFTVR